MHFLTFSVIVPKQETTEGSVYRTSHTWHLYYTWFNWLNSDEYNTTSLGASITIMIKVLPTAF